MVYLSLFASRSLCLSWIITEIDLEKTTRRTRRQDDVKMACFSLDTLYGYPTAFRHHLHVHVILDVVSCFLNDYKSI